MDLKTYLESRDISHGEFAEMIGVTKGSISNYICGTRTPTLEIAAKIVEATKGKVTIDDLLFFKRSEQKHG